jgi:hypothetical protein
MGLDKVLCARGAWDGLGPKMATNIIQYPMGHDNGTRNIFHLYISIYFNNQSSFHIFSLQKKTHRASDLPVELTQVEVPTQLLLELPELEESGLEEPSDGWLVQLVHGTLELGSQLPVGFLGFQEKLAEELTRWGIRSDSFGENWKTT